MQSFVLKSLRSKTTATACSNLAHLRNISLVDQRLACREIRTRGGHSHRRRVQSCDRGQDAVKWSRHFLGVGQTVKQCAGHYLRHYWRSRGVADPFAHAQLIDGQGSRAKIRRGQAVKAVFRRSKILTPVAALDTAPMGVTPPCRIRPERQRQHRTVPVEASGKLVTLHSLGLFPPLGPNSKSLPVCG